MPTPLRIGDDEALANSHFNFSEPTIFFFHAFFESYQHVPATYIRTGKFIFAITAEYLLFFLEMSSNRIIRYRGIFTEEREREEFKTLLKYR